MQLHNTPVGARQMNIACDRLDHMIHDRPSFATPSTRGLQTINGSNRSDVAKLVRLPCTVAHHINMRSLHVKPVHKARV